MNLELDLLDVLINNANNLDEVVSFLPCNVHINAIDDFRLLYMDSRLCHDLGYSSFEALGQSVISLDMCHPDDLENAKQVCHTYLSKIDTYSTYSFIQRIRMADGRYRAMYTTGMLVNELNGLLQFSVNIQPLMNQSGNMKQMIADDDFARKNAQFVQLLTPAESRVLPLWLSHRSNAEIAKANNVTEQTIKTYKKRIFSKLRINSFAQLYAYGRAFGWIENDFTTSETGMHDQPLLPELFGRRIGHSSPRYPGFFHIHHRLGFAVKYMDPDTCIEFESDLSEIQAMGSEFQALVTHPADLPRVKDRLNRLSLAKDDQQVITYFQRIRLRPETTTGYTLVVTSVRYIPTDDTFICLTNSTDQLESFSKRISNALNSRYNTLKAMRNYRTLTKMEKTVFSMLAAEKSIKGIATDLIRSIYTIDQHKKNIYRKLEINKLSELIEMDAVMRLGS